MGSNGQELRQQEPQKGPHSLHRVVWMLPLEKVGANDIFMFSILVLPAEDSKCSVGWYGPSSFHSRPV